MTSRNLPLSPSLPKALPPMVLTALLACYLIWGSTYFAIRIALLSLPPFFQMGTRFLAAGVILMLCVKAKGLALPSHTEWRNALIVGTLMLGGGMGLTASAEVHIGSGLVAASIAVVPMLVCAWGLGFGRRPSRFELLGMAIGLGGVLLLVQGASFSAAPVGIACIAGATLCWSLGSVLSTTKFPLGAGPGGFASEMLCGGVVLLLLSWCLGERIAFPVQAQAIAAWVYLVIFGSLIGFSAYLYLLKHTTAAVATSYAFVNPLVALLVGVGLAGEYVTPDEWLACGVILLGVILILVASQHQKSPRGGYPYKPLKRGKGITRAQ